MKREKEMTEGVLSRRNDAMKVLYDRYAASLLGLCCRYCTFREDAEDVLHEGFIKILEHLDGFRSEHDGALLAWMKRIMVNTALNHLRDRQRSEFHAITFASGANQEYEEEPDLFGPILTSISQEVLLKMITSLPVGYRTVFNLYVFEEFTHKEIAAVLHCSENTSKSQLSKARALLRNKIQRVLQTEKAITHGQLQTSDR